MSSATTTHEATNGKVVESKRVKQVDRKLVLLKRLANAGHNPPDRISWDSVRSLADSMERIGLLQPIVITRNYELIDGHRRVAAALSLRWPDIEASIVDDDPATLYADVNSNAKRLSGNEKLYVYLSNPKAVPDRVAAKHKKAEETVGRDTLRRVCDLGYSIGLYDTAYRIGTYVGNKSAKFIKAALLWLLEHRCVAVCREAIRHQNPPRVLVDAIHKNKPVKMTLSHE